MDIFKKQIIETKISEELKEIIIDHTKINGTIVEDIRVFPIHELVSECPADYKIDIRELFQSDESLIASNLTNEIQNILIENSEKYKIIIDTITVLPPCKIEKNYIIEVNIREPYHFTYGSIKNNIMLNFKKSKLTFKHYRPYDL